MNKLKVTQLKSVIKRKKNQKLTIEALGLKGPNSVNVVPDNPATRGMVKTVEHLITVEEINN